MAPILSKTLLVDGKPPKRRVLARLRGYFLAGVLVTAPVAITLASAWWFVGFVDSKVVPLIPKRYNPDVFLKDIVGFEIGLPGLGVVVLLVLITLIGALTAGFVGRYVVHLGERVLARMPVIRNVYGAIKQIFETVLKQQSTAFRQAVLIEYPRRGIWAVGFITGNTEGEVQNLTKDDMVNVFLPTTPNPTSGFLLFVPRRELINLSMSVEEAIKMVISAGIVTPPYRRLEEKSHVPIVPASDRDPAGTDDTVEEAPNKAKRKKVVSPSAD